LFFLLKKVKMSREDLGYWTLPQLQFKDGKNWTRIPRVSRTVPFGYTKDPEDEDFLLPVKEELDALELAKQHLRQYLSHTGLKKRVRVETRRKKAATFKRELARRLEKTLKEVRKYEENSIGSHDTAGSTA
jgi:hypothetical protein